MGYTSSRYTMEWWDPHTKKLEYCSSAKFDEHKIIFDKGWLPGSELILGTNNSNLPTLKIDLSNHPFVKYYTFEVNVNFSPGGTPIGILMQYFEHHNMSYILLSTNNSPWNNAFPNRNVCNVWILIIGSKEPKSDMNGITIFFKQWKHPQHSVHHFYLHYYHQIQK